MGVCISSSEFLIVAVDTMFSVINTKRSTNASCRSERRRYYNLRTAATGCPAEICIHGENRPATTRVVERCVALHILTNSALTRPYPKILLYAAKQCLV